MEKISNWKPNKSFLPHTFYFTVLYPPSREHGWTIPVIPFFERLKQDYKSEIKLNHKRKSFQQEERVYDGWDNSYVIPTQSPLRASVQVHTGGWGTALCIYPHSAPSGSTCLQTIFNSWRPSLVVHAYNLGTRKQRHIGPRDSLATQSSPNFRGHVS